jgi:hypothetical protein
MMRSTRALAAAGVGLAILLGYTTAMARRDVGEAVGPAKKGKGDTPVVKGKDKQTETTKATKRPRAASINFRKAYGLPLASLGTLGSRIDAARGAPDPVALAHAAGELAVAEKVSKKKASLTSKALLAEAAELAAMRKEIAELKATFAVHQQIADAETNVKYWKDQIAIADSITKSEKDAIDRNELPTDATRRVLVNNYTTQYINIWVNGRYKLVVPPGSSKWFTIDHKWNPTILTGYGDADAQPTWGPKRIFGEFKTYTWNLQG